MTTQPQTATVQTDTLKAILEELRLLRNEINLLLPQEELDEYTNSDRVQESYRKALKQHPPVSV